MERLKCYEILFIINPRKEDSFKNICETIHKEITRRGGRIDRENEMGRRKLAYPIRKKDEGILYLLEFSIAPSHIDEMKNIFELNQDIIRFTISKKER